MYEQTLDNPLAAAIAIGKLKDGLSALGLELTYSSDAHALKKSKLAARSVELTPFFGPDTSKLPGSRFFWTQLVDREGRPVALQAFRLDLVADSLAEWAPSLTIGLYMRRGEVLVPTGTAPVANSIAERLRGKLVYHGELWVSGQWRTKNLFNNFTRLGILLAIVKWNPDAIWALTNAQMATHGHPTRMGYSHVERGFLRWQWPNDDIPAEEWLLACDKASLNQLVNASVEFNLQTGLMAT